MPSSIDRSAPAENASLPEVDDDALDRAVGRGLFHDLFEFAAIVVSSSTFIERPGISHVTKAMPSASVSILKS